MAGIHNLGYLQFYTAIYSQHGRRIPNFLREYLEEKDDKKMKRRVYQRESAVKKRRNNSYANKYIDKSSIEESFFASNSGLNIETTIAVEREKEKETKHKDHAETLCKSGCGLIGHYNKTSYLCPLNKRNQDNVAAWDAEKKQNREIARKVIKGRNTGKERNEMVASEVSKNSSSEDGEPK